MVLTSTLYTQMHAHTCTQGCSLLKYVHMGDLIHFDVYTKRQAIIMT